MKPGLPATTFVGYKTPHCCFIIPEQHDAYVKPKDYGKP
jgi:hypothetical protein